MAKHANLTTQPTVLSRDSLPTDGSIISGKQNRLSVPPNLGQRSSQKYSPSVADNQMTYAKECLYEHTTANRRFSF